MADMDSLIKQAENLGILNIDVDGNQLSPEVIQVAINATQGLNSKLNKNNIAIKLQEADRVVAAQYR